MTVGWDYWDTFRLHEAACLIAGVPVIQKRVSKFGEIANELPADARPVFKRLWHAAAMGRKYQNGEQEHAGLPKEQTLAVLPIVDADDPLLVAREELHRWVQAIGRPSAYKFLPSGGAVQATSPSPTSVATKETGDDEWKSTARRRAAEIIKHERARDLYPNQLDIAEEIAREFRRDGVMGTGGKPLTGTYIKRHALAGISSAQGRRLSTQTHRGK